MNQDDYKGLLESIEQSRDKLVIVEGVKDKHALEKLGFTNIFYINRQPLFKVVEFLQGKKEIIILTDLDSEGRKLYSRLKDELNNRGVKVDDRLRELLFKTELRQIEGMARYIERLEAEIKGVP